jgi:SAM-dependent methyltransferase
VSDDPKRIVERGYDAMADTFEDWAGRNEGWDHDKRISDFLELLPERPDVLELGCGAAAASTRMLAARARLIGIDISAEQIRRARERLPQAEFIHADMSKLELDEGSFDAVVSLYVFNHLPREDVPPLLRRIARWLRPGGYFLGTFSAREEDDREPWIGEWLGVEMFFDGEPMEVVLGHVRSAGLEVEYAEVETFFEPEPAPGEARFLWVRARKPSAPPSNS